MSERDADDRSRAATEPASGGERTSRPASSRSASTTTWTPQSCSSCSADLISPLVCAACRTPLVAEPAPGPFEVFGFERTFELDGRTLMKRLLQLSKALHPDFYAGADPQVRSLAERSTAELNAAHKILANDYRRADYLVRALGGPTSEADRQMPQAFLMEVLEWNEALEELRAGEGAADGPEQLASQLREARDEAMDALRGHLVPLPAAGAAVLADARRDLNAVRYVDRALEQLSEIRLGRASSRR
ncbi:iron-sulfur cluster co-chaperone HscB C-terminal domain-containing protein [Engelhardtia mirabilis]|uniref:J domain-containing protein n=1 Tax=Engelhardtia mirabilis TaxID=2528011 RepID=A0A518BQN6_9BACT|nr:hypothetical protein Pla133_43950 [Planctomycetes bacterium Pla133]QDV03603.1 hypothetical protein Pla86_43940 [Planctomycetes bacterium Pla86]